MWKGRLFVPIWSCRAWGVSFGVHYIAFLVGSLLRDLLALCFEVHIPLKLCTILKRSCSGFRRSPLAVANIFFPQFFFCTYVNYSLLSLSSLGKNIPVSSLALQKAWVFAFNNECIQWCLQYWRCLWKCLCWSSVRQKKKNWTSVSLRTEKKKSPCLRNNEACALSPKDSCLLSETVWRRRAQALCLFDTYWVELQSVKEKQNSLLLKADSWCLWFSLFAAQEKHDWLLLNKEKRKPEWMVLELFSLSSKKKKIDPFSSPEKENWMQFCLSQTENNNLASDPERKKKKKKISCWDKNTFTASQKPNLEKNIQPILNILWHPRP